jgi:hypothetical protein
MGKDKMVGGEPMPRQPLLTMVLGPHVHLAKTRRVKDWPQEWGFSDFQWLSPFQ